MAEPAYDPPDEPEPDLWLRGARRVGERPLDPSERAWIERVRKAHRARVVVGWSIVPGALTLSALPAMVLHDVPAVAMAVGFFWFVTICVGVPVAILLVRDHARASRELRDDLAGGSAWVFESRTGAPVVLLEHSRRVVDVADTKPVTAHEDVIEVEPHAASQFYAPLSLGHLQGVGEIRLAQRSLAASERDELDRVQRRLLVPKTSDWVALAVLAVLLTVGLAGRARADVAWGPRATVDAVLAAVVLVTVVRRYGRSLLLARRIREDLAVGLVVHADGDDLQDAEFLPISRLTWRQQGAPAEWRNRSDAVDRLRTWL